MSNMELKMTHLATRQPVTIDLTEDEMLLAKSKSGNINESWETMCKMVHERTGYDIIGQFEIDTLGGRVFH